MLRKQPKTPHVGLFDFAVAREIFAPDSKVWCRPPKLPFTTVDPVAGSCAGYRMPAHRNVSARFGAGVRKASRERTRGGDVAIVVYGDLTARRLARVMRRSAEESAGSQLQRSE
jgi:hypothetical protein